MTIITARSPAVLYLMLWAGNLISISMACIISLIDQSKQKIVKTSTVDGNYAGAEKRVKQLNEKLNEKPNKKELFWVVTTIGV